MRCLSTSLVLLWAALMAAASAQGAWTLIDNLESASLGPLGGQGAWTTADPATATAFYEVAVDPANPDNQAVMATGTGGNGYVSLGANTIPDNTTGTVFFRMRNGELGDLVFGATDLAAPDNWDSYKGYTVMGVAGDPPANQFKVRDGGGFLDVGPYAADEWYNVWLVLDHTADMTDLYVSQGADPAALLGSGAFRTRADPTGDLVSLNIRMGAAQANNNVVGFLDDMYVTSGIDLSNPTVPEPASLALVVGVAGILLTRGRRR